MLFCVTVFCPRARRHLKTPNVNWSLFFLPDSLRTSSRTANQFNALRVSLLPMYPTTNTPFFPPSWIGVFFFLLPGRPPTNGGIPFLSNFQYSARFSHFPYLALFLLLWRPCYRRFLRGFFFGAFYPLTLCFWSVSRLSPPLSDLWFWFKTFRCPISEGSPLSTSPPCSAFLKAFRTSFLPLF